jgi:hypothetical protein
MVGNRPTGHVAHNAGVAGSSPAPAIGFLADGGGCGTPGGTHADDSRGPRALIAQWRADAANLWASGENGESCGREKCADELESALAADAVPSKVRNLLRWAIDFHLEWDPCEVERAWLASLPPDADAPLPGALAAAPSLLTEEDREALDLACNMPDGGDGRRYLRCRAVLATVAGYHDCESMSREEALCRYLLASDARLRGAA